jgi:hypothetical protein
MRFQKSEEEIEEEDGEKSSTDAELRSADGPAAGAWNGNRRRRGLCIRLRGYQGVSEDTSDDI